LVGVYNLTVTVPLISLHYTEYDIAVVVVVVTIETTRRADEAVDIACSADIVIILDFEKSQRNKDCPIETTRRESLCAVRLYTYILPNKNSGAAVVKKLTLKPSRNVFLQRGVVFGICVVHPWYIVPFLCALYHLLLITSV
jgi:hypothetical protein